MRFTEKFLHFIWQFRLYDSNALKTSDGKPIKVLNCGFPNYNAGPDFTTAKVIIDDTTWVGNIEIHLKASDWRLHKHQHDEAYDNVILHVVFENDEPVRRNDGTLLPTLALLNLIPQPLFERYDGLTNAVNLFPCQPQLKNVDSYVIDTFLSRMLVERLMQKAATINTRLVALNGDWDETFYHFLAANFGFKINAIPMQMLAQLLPQRLFAKHKNNSIQIEALVFGQAGFLNQNFEEEYPLKLKAEYTFLVKKYNLEPVDLSLWKFLRMRPQNFPTLRLAQFAGLVYKSSHLFSKILEIKNVKDLRLLYEDLPINEYWQTHYHFNKTAEKVNTQLGKSSIDNILINTVAQFLFAYGNYTNQHNFQTRAFYLLESIVSENNLIVRQYVEAGAVVKNAYQSQALLQLRKQYCNEKKCLNCGIGLKILKH